MKILSCPSCGGEVKIRSIFSKSAACSYCGQSSYLLDDHLEAKGKKAFLADYGSLFSIGQRCKWQGKSIDILGRIRYEYEDGFWDEWAIILGDKEEEIYWLEEDEGRLNLFTSTTTQSPNLPKFQDIKVGSTLSFEKHKIFVRAKSKAKIIGSEGEIPFQITNGDKADFIDGIASSPCGFEFLTNEVTFNQGQVLKLADFQF
jgi:hypothetical protein